MEKEQVACKYIESSWEANMIMSGLHESIDQRHSKWTKTEVKALSKFLEKNKKPIMKPMILFRGTTTEVPMISNKAPISTSRSRTIAKEFSGKNGYIHVFHLDPGSYILDFSHVKCLDTRVLKAKEREKEVLIVPGQNFLFLKKYKNNYHWRLTNSPPAL